MPHPIALTSAKVPNDLEIYPTFNVGFTYEENDKRDVHVWSLFLKAGISINNNNTVLKLETFNYGGFLQWFPNDTENNYYALRISQDKLYIAHLDTTTSSVIEYNKPIASEEYVTN